MSSSCLDCNTSLAGFLARVYECPKCHRKPLCGKCIDYATARGSFKTDPGAVKVVSLCFACFKSECLLDFGTHVDIVGPSLESGAPTIMLVHGGGSHRRMWRRIAAELAEAGYRCVLPDLPGHGTRVHEPLTLDSCLAVIRACYDEYCVGPATVVRPIYLGGSFGGYVGMEMLSRAPDLFSAAIIIVASQRVGAGATLKARLALQAMRFFSPRMWTETLAGGMIKMFRGAEQQLNLDDIDDMVVGSQQFFQQGVQQVDVLIASQSEAAMMRYCHPVLYLTGGADHHDMEKALLSVSLQNETSALLGTGLAPLTQSIVYEGASHFVAHDLRFQRRLHGDVRRFCDEVVARNRPSAAATAVPSATAGAAPPA